MVASVLMIAVIGAVVVLAALAFGGIKTVHEKGGEDVVKNVYIYLVLFATLMMTIGGSVAAFMAAADIVSPVVYNQTFEEYKRYGNQDKMPGEDNGGAQLSEDELMAGYQAVIAAEKERHIDRAQNSLLKSIGWIVIPFPVFVYFQRRLLKKEN